MELVVRLLGPVELIRHGTVVAAGGPTQRAVLAMLALRVGQLVGIDDLVDGIWGERDVSTAGRATIWPHISRIRAALRDGDEQPLSTVGGGYRLDGPGVDVDMRQFERLLDVGRDRLAGGHAGEALASLDRALGLWRGPALVDVLDFPFAGAVATRLDELRADAAEERIEARLALGEARSLLPELRSLVVAHPYRERLRGQLMLAHYRAGQQAAALEAYQAARSQLAIDLGVEPGPELERLHRQVLAQAEELVLPASGAPVHRIAAGRRRQLPRAPVLIGRSAQLRELERLCDRERLITLTGAGGSGKTALALALAHRVGSGFRDGTAFVDLAAVRRPEAVLPAIAEALGVSPGRASLATQLADYLAEHQLLVLLDNVEHVVDAAPELEPIVAATDGLLLATSRVPLGLRAEHLVEVPPLPVPAAGVSPAALGREPAVRLFLRATGASGGAVGTSPRELGAVGEVCRAVAGLPLAIEIAAAQTRALAVEELAGHFREQLPSLRGRARDTPARQQTVDATVGWSLDLLAAEDRQGLYRLTAFAGSFDTGGVTIVCDLDRDRALELVNRLLEASLLARQPAADGWARFRLLEPVRAVARAHADPRLLADAADRHAAYITAEIDRLSPAETGIQHPADLARLRLQHQDLMAGLRHLVVADPDRCAILVQQLDDYWQWTGREADVRRFATTLLEGGRLSDGAACRVLAGSAWAAFLLGQVEAMRAAIDLAMDRARKVADPAVKALVREGEARLAMTVGGDRHAQAAAQAAVKLAREAGQPKLLAVCLGSRVLAAPAPCTEKGWGDEALEIARGGPMPCTEAWILGCISANLGGRDPAASVRAERAALDICERFRARGSTMGNGLSGILAGHLLAIGDVEEARSVAVDTLRTADHLGHRGWAAVAISLLGDVEAEMGRAERALVLILAGEAHAARRGMGDLDYDWERQRKEGVVARLEAELGGRRAAAARRRAEAMDYRDAVALAFDVNRPRGLRRRGRRVTGRTPARV